jgi:hypothetical protein
MIVVTQSEQPGFEFIDLSIAAEFSGADAALLLTHRLPLAFCHSSGYRLTISTLD